MYIPKYGDFQQEIILCDWDEDLTPVRIILPDPPNLDQVDNRNKPVEDQMWEIPQQKRRNSWIKSLNSYQLGKYIEQEHERSFEKGYWLYINGKLTYLVPSHYFYLQWWDIGASGTGYPEMRSRDRKFWYFWKYMVLDSKTILGMNYMKHRREGATSRAQCENYRTVIQGENLHGGIQSKTGADAKKVFIQHLIRPWKKLPEFFRPIWDGTTNPKESLRFDDPAERITVKNRHRDKETDALGSWIDYEDSSEAAYDSQELAFFHDDEVGKCLLANVHTRWNDYVKKCLTKGRFKVGNAMRTSTVAEMEKGGGENFYLDWEESDITKLTNGTTDSGLINYFCPAYDGFEGFVDQYGESVIEAPTTEQYNFFVHRSRTNELFKDVEYLPNQGAKGYLENIRENYRKHGKWDQLANEKRMNPFTVKEGFRASGNECAFNKEKITSRLEAVEHKKDLWIRCNLSWGKMYDPIAQKTRDIDTFVIMTPSSNGRFYFHSKWWNPSNMLLNRTRKAANGQHYPVNNDVFCSGIDSYDHDKVKDQKPSKGACTPMLKWNMHDDPETKPFCEWNSKKQIIRYCERPPGGPRVFYEDMIMLHFLIGCETLIETNKINCYNYFVERNYEPFIANRPESAFGLSRSSQDPNELGVAGSLLMKNAEFDAIDQYVETYWELMDDPEVLQDLLDASIAKLTKFHLTVAFGLTLLQDKKYLRPVVNFQEGVTFVKKYDIRGSSSIRRYEVSSSSK